MQRGPLKLVICGRWKHCSKVIRRPGVCYCAVLSVVRKMSETKVHVSVEQSIIIIFLKKEGCKPSEICSRLLPERYPQVSRPLAQVYRKLGRLFSHNIMYGISMKIGRLCWKVTISVSENKSMFLFYLQIIIHIGPTLVFSNNNNKNVHPTRGWHFNHLKHSANNMYLMS